MKLIFGEVVSAGCSVFLFGISYMSYFLVNIGQIFSYIMAKNVIYSYTLEWHFTWEAWNVENVPQLKITEVVQVHYKLINNIYQQDSRFLWIFILNKQFGQLLEISPSKFIFSNFYSEFLYIWSMVYWSKFQTIRDRRQNRFNFDYYLMYTYIMR